MDAISLIAMVSVGGFRPWQQAADIGRCLPLVGQNSFSNLPRQFLESFRLW